MTLLLPIEPARVWWWWRMAAPHIDKLIARGQQAYDRGSIQGLCQAGTLRLWLAFDGGCIAALVTRFADYPRYRSLVLRGMGGRLPKDWRRLLAIIERWAEIHGCRLIEMGGRWGWLRHLKDYQFQQVLLSKHLSVWGNECYAGGRNDAL